MRMKRFVIACSLTALLVGVGGCNGTLGVPPSTVEQADRVSIGVTQGLTLAWSSYDFIVLALEREVQAPNSWVRGDTARRVREVVQAILNALNAADAARTAGNAALMRVKTNDAIGLITGLMHDFPQLAGAVGAAIPSTTH